MYYSKEEELRGSNYTNKEGEIDEASGNMQKGGWGRNLIPLEEDVGIMLPGDSNRKGKLYKSLNRKQ